MTERKMTGLYVFLLLTWWGGWLALDMWRIEHLLTDADKWAGFRRDILWCAGSAALSLFFLMTGTNKKSSAYALSVCLALIVPISVAIVAGSSFIHWEFDVPMFLMMHTCAGWVMTLVVPLMTFFSARF
ncbi:hypothetical protein [Serratia marcescens]|nr:hypothetical protein [Serratia marcescens]MDQ9544579.1 hypothetical protein [Serratia marcescens]MDQ9551565.1 hypothetical protein [Serratia marcescens]MDQ9672315.1 hypothetical protein [Serratia marcescens]MDQ9783729.1 hypothetical protein [Serratia marcescens]